MISSRIIVGDSRRMGELDDSTVDLVVTSPPYWHIKNYNIEGQIGYGQSLHDYLRSLYMVWLECFRVLKPGSRLCINIGDQFLRSVIYGRYKVSPLHSEVISQCEKIGFDYMGSVIWQKKTTMNTTGGANVMGSYPYPPNGLIEIDYEFILIFKKPGESRHVSKEIKERSKLTKEEWKEYFSGHWYFNGVKQSGHEAMFPEELPRRLIKMFSFVEDTILDPFLGSGTTAKVARELERNSIGYEINSDFVPLIKEKLTSGENLFSNSINLEIMKQINPIEINRLLNYYPIIKDAKPIISPEKFKFRKDQLYKVKRIIDERTLELDDGLMVKLSGIIPKYEKSKEIMSYLNDYVKDKSIYLEFETDKLESEIIPAYVFLKNKIFINKELIRSGMALVSNEDFKYKKIFMKVKEG